MVYTAADGVIPEQLSLSKEKQHSLTDTADRVVAETLRAYELLIANNRQVDSRVWKRVKSREKVHVFRTRRSGSKHQVNEKDPSRPRLLSNNTVEQEQRDAIAAGRPHGFTPDEEDVDENTVETSVSGLSQNTHSSSSDCGSFTVFPEESVLERVKPPHVPLIGAIGNIEGTIEDVAYGGLAHTNEAWHERFSYVKNDGFDGRKVLASMKLPSEEDPFNFVGIKWATRDMGPLLSRRDLVFIESSGMAFDSDGERIYYSLAHSVDLSEVPVLPDRLDVVRLKLSICYIMRQINDTQIEVYARGFADMGGSMPEVIGISVFSQGIADVVGIAEASYLKKLSWLMARRRASDASAMKQTKGCGVCGKNLRTLTSFLKSGCSCAICRQSICQKCTVQKTLTLDATEGIQRQLSFCVSCVLEARQMSAWDVATTQLQRRR